MWLFLLYAIITIAFVLFAPKPTMPEAELPNLSKFQYPTADEGRVVPEIYGTILISGSNCFFASNLRNKIIYTN